MRNQNRCIKIIIHRLVAQVYQFFYIRGSLFGLIQLTVLFVHKPQVVLQPGIIRQKRYRSNIIEKRLLEITLVLGLAGLPPLEVAVLFFVSLFLGYVGTWLSVRRFLSV